MYGATTARLLPFLITVGPLPGGQRHLSAPERGRVVASCLRRFRRLGVFIVTPSLVCLTSSATDIIGNTRQKDQMTGRSAKLAGKIR